MKTLYKRIAFTLIFVLGAINISPIIHTYANTSSNNSSEILLSNEQNNFTIPDLILSEQEIKLANEYIQSQLNSGNIVLMPRSFALGAFAGSFLIPGVGKVIITTAGKIIVGGATVAAGSWLGKKISNWINNYKIEQAYTNSKNKGVKTKDHSVQTGGSLPTKGRPNSSKDLKDSKGIKQRRYYDKNGNADLDIDYRHGGNGKEPFPHKHKWTNGVRGKWFK